MRCPTTRIVKWFIVSHVYMQVRITRTHQYHHCLLAFDQSARTCQLHFHLPQVFTDFEVEPHHECTYDNVQIYDGASEQNRSLGRFCGSNGVPDPIVSRQNHLLMLFYSDASVQRKGFRATHTTGFPVTS